MNKTQHKTNKRKRKILLIEPNYRNKYPPLGLMKISSYHKALRDEVVFVKGLDKNLRDKVWDRIYVTTLFTFYFNETVKTILYYKRSVKNTKDFFIGGIASSLIPEKFEEQTGLKPFIGLLDRPGILDDNDIIVDELTPDYSMLEEIEYDYPAKDAYYSYSTRGCIRKCPFCAVPSLEPKYKPFISISEQIKTVSERYGERKDLLLLDNNVLASNNFKDIISEIKALGFVKDGMFKPPNLLQFYLQSLSQKYMSKEIILENIRKTLYELRRRIKRYPKVLEQFYTILESNKIELDGEFNIKNIKKAIISIMPLYEKYRSKAPSKRRVDFNQGIDARLLDDEKIKLLSEICIHPLRIAFDHIEIKDEYIEKVKLADKYRIKELSNYILYNFNDKPVDLYERLKINVELNEELNSKIYSFPMKYVPVDFTDRSYVGKHWNKKYLKSINKIINVTKGIVAPGKDFFEKAFGRDSEEYFKILLMPENYILNRFKREADGSIDKWWEDLNNLSNDKKEFVVDFIKRANFKDLPLEAIDNDIIKVLEHYKNDGMQFQIALNS